MEAQARLRYHNGQKQDKEYCVPMNDMWYGVVCKAVMSSSMSAGYSLGGCRNIVPCLAMTAIFSGLVTLLIKNNDKARAKGNTYIGVCAMKD